MSQPKFKKRKLWEKKNQPSELSSALWKVFNTPWFPIVTTLLPSQSQRHHLAGGWSRLWRSLLLRTPNFTDSKHWQVWWKYLRKRREIFSSDWWVPPWDWALSTLAPQSALPPGQLCWQVRSSAVPLVPLVPGNVLIVRALSRVYWSLPGSFLPRRLGGTQCWA